MYVLNEALPFLLGRAGNAMTSAFSEEIKGLGLSVPMWRVLAALWGNGEQNLNSLAHITGVEISTLSRQVTRMSEKGLVVRSKSNVEWRAINIDLTGQGRQLVENMLPVVERHESAALSGVNAADVRRLKELLKRVYENISELDRVIPIEIS